MEQYVLDMINRQIKNTRFILLAIVSLVVVVSLFMARSWTRNIQRLVKAVRRIASGDFSAQVHIKSRDEMGELGKTFNTMVPALEERVKMRQSLDLAKEIQQSLLPPMESQPKGLDIAASSIYCDQTGGDFYDYLELCCRKPEVTGVIIGDVSDHGIPAALLMATARAFIRARVTQPGSMSEIIHDVNQLLVKDTQSTSQFLTLLYLEIDPPEKCLKWVRAGHEPALLFDPATDGFEELRGSGTAMGVDQHVTYKENLKRGLTSGQVLLLATDGVWDTRNPQGEQFGKDRTKTIVRSHAGSSAGTILNSILDELTTFRGKTKQEDDITLVVIKITET